MKKSPRHSKITGDFAEGLFLYWLSKHGYECVRVDHTGIDLIACDPRGKRMGISVKARSRYEGTEKTSVNLPPDGFLKAEKACAAFGCEPYYGIAVDAGEVIRCFLLPLDHLKKLAGGSVPGMRYWGMADCHVARYRTDPLVQRFELQITTCSWSGIHSAPTA
jgi:hypothetical protein